MTTGRTTLRRAADAFGVAMLGAAVWLSSPAAASATGDGTALVVVEIDGAGAPLLGGGSATPFSLRLPTDAACPGDSQDGQFRVQGFLVPEAADPASISFRGLRPQVEGGWALYRTDTTTYMNDATNKAVTPGGEGRIINVPPLSFAVFDQTTIAPGRYHIGIACSQFGETKRAWWTEIDVAADPDDEPARLAWQVVDPPVVPGPAGAGGPSPAASAALGVVGAAGLLLVRQRRRVRGGRQA